MHYLEIVVEVSKANENLLHYSSNLILLIKRLTGSRFFSDVLGERHVHLFKDDVEPVVLEVNSFSLHDVGAMIAPSPSLINVLKPFQNLDFPLLFYFAFGLELRLESLNSHLLSRLQVNCLEYISEASRSNYLSKLVLPKDNGLWP